MKYFMAFSDDYISIITIANWDYYNDARLFQNNKVTNKTYNAVAPCITDSSASMVFKLALVIHKGIFQRHFFLGPQYVKGPAHT